MDGLPTKVYDGESLQVTAGLCLFYVNPEKKLMPIAIQVFHQIHFCLKLTMNGQKMQHDENQIISIPAMVIVMYVIFVQQL